MSPLFVWKKVHDTSSKEDINRIEKRWTIVQRENRTNIYFLNRHAELFCQVSDITVIRECMISIPRHGINRIKPCFSNS